MPNRQIYDFFAYLPPVIFYSLHPPWMWWLIGSLHMREQCVYFFEDGCSFLSPKSMFCELPTSKNCIVQWQKQTITSDIVKPLFVLPHNSFRSDSNLKIFRKLFLSSAFILWGIYLLVILIYTLHIEYFGSIINLDPFKIKLQEIILVSKLNELWTWLVSVFCAYLA